MTLNAEQQKLLLRLSKTWQKKKWPHLALFRPQDWATEQEVETFFTHLTHQFLGKGFDWKNCPDILLLCPSEERGHYKVDDLEKLSEFLKYRPLQIPVKWVVFQHGQGLSSREVVNRLLKIFESPPLPVYFFVLTSSAQGAFLPTLEGRFQLFHIPYSLALELHQLPSTDIPFFQWASHPAMNSITTALFGAQGKKELDQLQWGSSSSSDFIDWAKKNGSVQTVWPKLITSYGQKVNAPINVKIELLEELKWMEKSAAYNAPFSDRWNKILLLINHWKDHSSGMGTKTVEAP